MKAEGTGKVDAMIQSLPKLIKMAREHAILGQYQKSLDSYKKAGQIIVQRVNSISDVYVQDRWKTAQKDLGNEVAKI